MGSGKLKGLVKWFSTEKGFGFIRADNKDIGDVFVSYEFIQSEGFKTLEKGQKVEFDLGKDERGSFAKKVKAL